MTMKASTDNSKARTPTKW